MTKILCKRGNSLDEINEFLSTLTGEVKVLSIVESDSPTDNIAVYVEVIS